MASSSDTSQKEKPVPLGGKVWAFSGNGGRTSVCGGTRGTRKVASDAQEIRITKEWVPFYAVEA